MKSTKYLSLILSVYLFLFLATPVFAQGNGPGGAKPTLLNSEEREARMEEQQEKRDERIAARCQQMQERIATRVSRYKENLNVHAGNYDRLIAKLREISTSLNDKYDVDTTEFDGLVVDLETSVGTYSTHYDLFLSALEDTADDATDTCGDGTGMRYGDMMQEARGHLQEAIAARQEIRSTYAHEIRGAIKDLREQIGSMMMEDETVEDSMESEE